MSKKRNSPDPIELFPSQTPYNSENWQERVAQVGYRFNRQYQKQDLELPAEVQEMPIYQEWVAGLLSGKIASPFWEIAQPKKKPELFGYWLWCQLVNLSLAGLVSILLWARN